MRSCCLRLIWAFLILPICICHYVIFSSSEKLFEINLVGILILNCNQCNWCPLLKWMPGWRECQYHFPRATFTFSQGWRRFSHKIEWQNEEKSLRSRRHKNCRNMALIYLKCSVQSLVKFIFLMNRWSSLMCGWVHACITLFLKKCPKLKEVFNKQNVSIYKSLRGGCPSAAKGNLLP